MHPVYDPVPNIVSRNIMKISLSMRLLHTFCMTHGFAEISFLASVPYAKEVLTPPCLSQIKLWYALCILNC